MVDLVDLDDFEIVMTLAEDSIADSIQLFVVTDVVTTWLIEAFTKFMDDENLWNLGHGIVGQSFAKFDTIVLLAPRDERRRINEVVIEGRPSTQGKWRGYCFVDFDTSWDSKVEFD